MQYKNKMMTSGDTVNVRDLSISFTEEGEALVNYGRVSFEEAERIRAALNKAFGAREATEEHEAKN